MPKATPSDARGRFALVPTQEQRTEGGGCVAKGYRAPVLVERSHRLSSDAHPAVGQATDRGGWGGHPAVV